MKTYFSTIALLIFLLSSCGMHMEKRHYNKGFHVTFNTNKHTTFGDKRKENKKIVVAKSDVSEETEVQNESLITSKQEDISFEQSSPIDNETPQKKRRRIHSEKTDITSITASESSDSYMTESEIKKKISSTPADGDTYLYLISGLIAASAFGVSRLKRSETIAVSKWARSNKTKSKLIIFLAQFGLGYAGYQVGYHLNDLGYTISNTTQTIAAIVSATAFISMFVNERKRSIIKDSATFFQKKAGYALIGASFFATMMGAGNGIESSFVSATPISHFIPSSFSDTNPKDSENYSVRSQDPDSTKGSRGFILFFWIFMAVILTIVLSILSCAAVCYFGSIGMLAILGSVILLVAYNIGMSRWYNSKKARNHY